MSTPLAVTYTQGRRRPSTLRTAIIAGLVGNVVVNVILQVLIVQALIVPLTIIMVLTLLIAGVCATRWRWAPLLAVLWVVVSVVPGAEPYIYNLTHPAETGKFIATLLSLVLLLIAVVAGVAATISGEGQVAEGRAPHWLMRFLIGTASFVLGASLVAMIPPPDASAGVSAEALAQLPALVSGRNTFEQAELRARVARQWPCGSKTGTPRRTPSTSTRSVSTFRCPRACPPSRSSRRARPEPTPSTAAFPAIVKPV